MKNIFLQVMVLIIAIVITGCVSDTKGENSSTNPTGLSIEKETVELNIGETTTPAIIVLPADATNKNVTWTSSNTSTAVVVEGKVTAIGEGETIITASTVDGKYYDSVTIKVKKVLEVTGLKVDQKLLELKVGESTTVAVTVIPSNAIDKSLSWSSSNTSVATVVNGVITAVGKGEAVITVATSTGKFPKVINVKVTQTSITTGPAVITTNQAFIATEILGKPTNQSVAINVIPGKKMELYFEYGTESGKFTERTSTSAVEAGIPVEVVIDKLKSNTTYYYQMRYREIGANSFEAGKENRFVTQRNVGNTFVFTVQADPHRDENTSLELYMKTLQNVAKDKSDFHIDLGDTFMTEKFAKTEKEVVQRYIEERSYFGVIGGSIPLFLVNGNHEGENGWMLNGGAENLAVWASNARNKYYVNPKPDTFYSGNKSDEKFVGQRGGYYSWEWGDALFVVLDPFWYSAKKSTSLETNWNYTLGKVQYDWFKGVLENSKAKYKFVFAHNLVGGADKDARGGVEPAKYCEWGGLNSDGSYGFDKNRPGWGKPIHQLMVDNKVSAFFHGHDHFFDKQELDGIIYQLVPQPGNPGFNNVGMAAEYGYKEGVIMPSAGHLRVTVSTAEVKVEYVRAYLEKDENRDRQNGVSAYSYIITK